jgi:hypothetical protein
MKNAWTEEIEKLRAENKELTESRNFWKREWRLMEAAAGKAEAEVEKLRAENERFRIALEHIKDWPYDIMGDCVYDARKEAAEALGLFRDRLKEGEG